MAGTSDPNQPLMQFLNQLLGEVESGSENLDFELRSKIKALEREISKVPAVSSHPPDELEIAKKLDEMSAKLNSLDELLSSTSAEDVQVRNILGKTADIWMPAITATAEERKKSAANSAATKQNSPEK
eukprot:TRINITY_DN2930_c0_g1_i1.p1 TRINITY_DN2930_c0_g1~~TRINITY_DN2930_c0_g1_i1.p1  ORF type:complete len:128 (-),score=26.74 TRINITY_DN2930_c0_g1_i1:384-767(-)